MGSVSMLIGLGLFSMEHFVKDYYSCFFGEDVIGVKEREVE